jgi:hypothetical protein
LNRGACPRRSSPERNRRSAGFRRAEPIHRLLHERRSQLNAAPDLCGKFVETLGSKHAGSALVRGRKHRCHGKMKARLKGDGLIYDSKTAIEFFELATHQGKPTVYRKIVDVIVGTEELSEGGLNERRLACAGTFGRCRQPRGHLFR